MRIDFEITQWQATAVLVLLCIVFLMGAMYAASKQKTQMQKAGWVGPDDWSCLKFKGGPDSDGIVHLFNDSMGFEQCGLSDNHRIIANSVYERSATGIS